ncbi:MAG: HPF/RaiA family ribosome-associated protein [Planctomycetaceae bacterium]|nr:HPF/RaiA family ribosome-associated protein [Planctomycetaceae bacterium]
MKISVHVDSGIPAHASELINRRCLYAFGRFDNAISEVFVTLTDENGPKGGDSIRCVIRVQLHRRTDVIIHEQCDTFERAVGLAVERAGRQVARRMGRRGFANETLRRTVSASAAESIPIPA